MSTLTQRIVSEIVAAPEPVQEEVLDFVLFIKARAGNTPIPGSPGRIQRTPGVCGGEACVGMTRIAVWMLEEARRAGGQPPRMYAFHSVAHAPPARARSSVLLPSARAL